MRVLLLSAEYPPQPGGVGDYTHRLAQVLRARGVEAAVLTSKGVVRLQDDVPVVREVRSWGRRLRADVVAAAASWRADVLHIQYQTGAYGMNPAINLLPARVDLPVAVTFHDLRMPYLAPKVAPLRRYVTRLLIESAHAVVVTNQEDAERLAGESNDDSDPDIYTLSKPLYPPALLIPIGSNIARQPEVDRATVRAGAGVAPEQTLVAYFGMISRSKGLSTLVAALARCGPHMRLLIIGGAATNAEDIAYKHELEQLIAQLGVGERVLWTGYVSDGQVSEYLQSADLAALPFLDGASYRRGSLLAALSHWVPTITTTPAVTLAPRLRDGEEAVLVAPGDIAGLAAALERVGRDQALRDRLAQQSGTIAQQFGWDAIAAAHCALYEGLCSKR